jgi:hypothetical protein
MIRSMPHCRIALHAAVVAGGAPRAAAARRARRGGRRAAPARCMILEISHARCADFRSDQQRAFSVDAFIDLHFGRIHRG